MQLNEILELVPVGGAFYRKSKPDVLYERIGILIERDGFGWARLEGNNYWGYAWTILPEQRIDEDIHAADWMMQKSRLEDRPALAKKPKLRPLITEKTRHAWTLYDPIEAPAS